MDECDDDEVRGLVRFFKQLARKAISVGARLRICLSSRHYPQISIDNCPEVVVEDHNRSDILRFVEIEAEDYRPIAEIKHDIMEKSSGVFLWVVLVINMLQKDGRGKSAQQLRQKLKGIPPKLGDLFRALFHQKDDEDAEMERDQAIRLIQIILFAIQPMTLDQIHAAMAFGRTHQPSFRAWKDSAEYLDTDVKRKEFVVRVSRGLVEEGSTDAHFRDDEFDSIESQDGDVSEDDQEETEGHPTYQFIHETVRDFFRSDEGFQLLGMRPETVTWSGHLMLATCCVHYLATLATWEYVQAAEDSISARQPPPNELISLSAQTSAPLENWRQGRDWHLLDYISAHVFDHVDGAAQYGAPPESIRVLIQSLSHDNCKLLNEMSAVRKKTRFKYGSTILMAAIGFNALHAASFILDMGFDVNEPSYGSSAYPLHEALRGPLDHVGTGAIRNFDEGSQRWLLRPQMLLLLLSHDADVNVKDSQRRTSLHYAAETSEELVAIVLAKKPLVNEKDQYGWTPLDCTINYVTPDRDKIVKILEEHGAKTTNFQ